MRHIRDSSYERLGLLQFPVPSQSKRRDTFQVGHFSSNRRPLVRSLLPPQLCYMYFLTFVSHRHPRDMSCTP